MSDRQILYRKLAERFGGEFYIRTGATRSTFYLDVEIRGTSIEVRGTSVPYSVAGGTTDIRAIAESSLGVVLRVSRFGNMRYGYIRNLFLRDVIVGDECFDRDWVIRARNESHAQAYLGKTQRGLIDAIPATELARPRGVNGPLSEHYNFEARGRVAIAYFDGFETDEERMLAAIDATIALAQRPTSLLEQWRLLAADLNARLESTEKWSDDGSTRISMSIRGMVVVVSPVADKLGWRRLRLRTRVYCENGQGLPPLHYVPGDSDKGLPQKVVEATKDAGIVVLRCDGKRIWIDLDGNVCDPSRIQLAAQAVAQLAIPNSQIGPYR